MKYGSDALLPMKCRQFLVLLLILQSLLVLSGCTQAELNTHRQLWKSQGFEDYQYDFQWNCYCVPDFVKPVIVSVRNGAIAGVSFSEEGLPVDPSNFTRYHTIKGSFYFIQDAIDRDAYEISVTYDSEFGYPTSASIDYERYTVDEEMGFTAKQLVRKK